uniref:Myocardial zonula adherens protein n=1 Tax=Gasterosteus aculeatus aculeatus TaxID=481459 RepID=G3PTF7_GASAC
MFRYGSGQSVSTTTTTEGSADFPSQRGIQRLRLTLHPEDNGHEDKQTTNSDTPEKEKDANVLWKKKKKKNGLIQRERPAGRESPQQHLRDMTNGAPETAHENHGPNVYGVVQRMGSDRQQEVMAREWTSNQLQDEMKYIREVRNSLEKVRERMYGQFGGMQQSMQKLSQEIKSANSHRRSLESEVRIRTTAMDSFDQMNSSLISANIGLQKSLLENCQKRVDTRDEVKNLRSTCNKTQEQLREKEKELQATQIENQTLKLQVESAREANNRALQELSAKLKQEYEEKLQQEQQKHREEIENLQAQLDEYIRRLEEAEKNIRIAEAKIAERDQRIVELERLLGCMEKEKSQLYERLQKLEQRLRLMEQTDTTDATEVKRSKELKSESVDLRERIKHLNDMVFCQQRKVKGMIEENSTRGVLETSEIGVGCDVLPRHEAKGHDVEPPVPSEPTHPHPIQHPPPVQPPPSMKSPPPTLPSSATLPVSPTPPSSQTQPLTPMQPSSPTQSPSANLPSPTAIAESPTLPPSPTQPSNPTYLSSPTSRQQHPYYALTKPSQPRTFTSNNLPPSRLESSLLRYTPGEYSRFLQHSSSVPGGLYPYTRPSDSEPPVSPVQSGRDELDTETSLLSSGPRSRAPQVETPFMKLLQTTKKIDID